MITKNSDYDFVMIVNDVVKKEYEKKYTKISKDPEFDIFVKTVAELKRHAIFGSDTVRDRFSYVYIEVMSDKTGKIQKIVNNKSVISKKEAGLIISSSLDAFINQIYRSAKCRRDGNLIAAHFEMTEAISWLLNCIFALEGRVKPYYKYLQWDLKQHPLKKLPWNDAELMKKLMKIVKDGDEKTLMDLFKKTRPIFKKAGYGSIYDGWKGKYKVGE